jgi:hypothetical protein
MHRQSDNKSVALETPTPTWSGSSFLTAGPCHFEIAILATRRLSTSTTAIGHMLPLGLRRGNVVAPARLGARVGFSLPDNARL